MNRELDDIREFLEHESDLLDRGDFAGWVDLCTADATYWMPVSADQTDPLGEISILYENRTLMDIRKYNYAHPLSPAFESPVRCSHIVGGVRLLPGEGPGIHVRAKFHCALWYRDEQRLFAGVSHYVLHRIDSTLRIHHKRVDLVNAEAWHKSIPIYL